jgi:hypothetical protein
MAFQTFALQDGRIQVRCTSPGPLVHIVPRSDGMFTIQEEDTGRIYDDYRAALLIARRIGQDPDL